MTHPFRTMRRGAAAVALVATALIWGVPAGAAVPATATTTTTTTPASSSTLLTPLPHVLDDQAVNGHLLDVASSSKPVSPWVATDLTALEATAPIVGAVGVAQGADHTLVVAGRTAAGHLVVFTSTPQARAWTTADVTTLGVAPAAAGSPSVVVDAMGITHVFFRTVAGDLDEIENGRGTANPWLTTDLTARTAPWGGTTIAGNPAAIAQAGFATAVYARSSTGQLVSFTLTTDRTHPWYYVNVSALAQGPAIQGTPAVVPAPDGFGLTAVYALSATGTLVEFANDDAGWHLWSVRDVSAALSLPTMTSSPSALAGLPTVVTTVTAAGHLLAISIPTVSLVGASSLDVSGAVRRKVVPGRTAPVVAARAGYTIAAMTPGSHLAAFHVSGAAKPAPSFVDMTMQPLTEQFGGADPAAIDLNGVTHVLVPSAGYIGLVARIVLGAESQDQYHAKIVDTPPGSNCNPYTASFGRGSTAGCARGTASEEWCSDFAQWVWETAGVDTTGISGASKTFVEWGETHHQFMRGISTAPKVGDAVVWGVWSPLWGAHVGIVVAVSGTKIDVVSGNSGPSTASYVWRSGLFAPATQTAQGDPILGYVSPVALPASATHTAVQAAPGDWPRATSWPTVSGSASTSGSASAPS